MSKAGFQGTPHPLAGTRPAPGVPRDPLNSYYQFDLYPK